jgi:hypothetical protein
MMAAPSITGATKALIGIGAGMLSLVVVVGLMFSMGVFNSTPKYPTVIVSVPPETAAAPTPTTRPEIAMTLAAINDPLLCAHVVIGSRADVDQSILGRPSAVLVNLDAQISNGKETAIYTAGTLSEELRFVDGKIFVRKIPGTKWTTSAVVSSWAMLLPMFGLTSPKLIDFVGNESRDGEEVYHFRTTKWWAPDLSRMALMDVGSLGIRPDTTGLDIWTDSFGKPVYASFSAVSMANDGRKLLDIETTYTFTDVGAPVDILNPMATPVPSVSPSAS